jgi:hypothetical protein
MLLVGEDHRHLGHYLQDTPAAWGGTSVRAIGEETGSEPVGAALLEFEHAYADQFGPPNDEAFSGHPLAERGLQPYSVFQILESSWSRALERMSSIHPSHRTKTFAALRHYVFAFHDTTFECVARGFTIKTHRGSVGEVLRASRRFVQSSAKRPSGARLRRPPKEFC